MMEHKGPASSFADVYFVTLFMSVCYGGVQSLKHFKAQEGPLENVLQFSTPEGGGIVIAGGQNRLYKLSAESLSLEAVSVTRPSDDNLLCAPHPLYCVHGKTATGNNKNHILLPLESAAGVLACASTLHGMCSFHQVSHDLNVSKPIEKTANTDYVASSAGTVAFFGSGRNANVLFVASAYDGQPSEYNPYTLSARVLTTPYSFSLRSSTPTAGSFVKVLDSFKNSYRARFLYGFSYNGFAYFVAVLNSGRFSGIFETRLVRVCEDDLSFRTYTELPMRCLKKVDDVNNSVRIGISASLEQSTAGNENGSKVLAVAFGTSFGGNRNSSDPSLGSELCFFDMDNVEAAFRKTVKSCNKGESTVKLIQFFGNNQLDSNCAPNEQSDDSIDECRPGVNSHIEGLLPLVGRATMEFKEGLMTSINVMKQNGATVAWVGDNSGYLHKVKLQGESSKLLFWTDLSRGGNVPIEKSAALDRQGAYGYFLLHNKVLQFPVGSCSIYSSCSKCLRGHEDPLRCGWCEGSCAHAGECPEGKSLIFDRCPVEVHTVYPRSGPTSGGTMLTFLGDNFGYWWREASNSIEITVGGQPCKVINWVSSLVKCRTLPVTQPSKVDIVISVNDTNRDAKKSYDVLDTLTFTSGFEFKVAEIWEVLPEYGPIAGGTNITLRGLNLDVGSQRVVTVGGNPCKVLKINETALECSTIAVSAYQVHRQIEVVVAIDGVTVASSSLKGVGPKFTYMLDPVIDGIVPRVANFSETPTIEVKGVHLDSVDSPTMVVQVTSLSNQQQESIFKACHVFHDGLKMVCPGPSLSEFSVISSTELQSHGRKIIAHVSFQMDGLRLPLHSVGSADYFTFAYCPAWMNDACDEKLPANKVPTLTAVMPRYGPVAGGTNLTLFGKNLDVGSVRVLRIGGSYCKINSVSSAFLDCTTSAVAPGEIRKKKRITLSIDGTEVPFISSGNFIPTFTYKPDPVIYKIKPPHGIFSGPSDIDVRGKHLDSAAAPFMLTRVTSHNLQEEHTGGVCRVVQSGRRMMCPIASVVKSCVTASVRREAYEDGCLVEVSFRMDGLKLHVNATGAEHRFHCTYQSKPGLGRLFPKEPDTEKTAADLHSSLFTLIAILFAIFLGIGLFLGTGIVGRKSFCRRLRDRKLTKASCNVMDLDHVGPEIDASGEVDKGCTTRTDAEEEQSLINSSSNCDEKIAAKQVPGYSWLASSISLNTEELPALHLIGQKSPTNSRAKIKYEPNRQVLDERPYADCEERQGERHASDPGGQHFCEKNRDI